MTSISSDSLVIDAEVISAVRIYALTGLSLMGAFMILWQRAPDHLHHMRILRKRRSRRVHRKMAALSGSSA